MKGHPILGVVTGFFFGLFLGITLFLYGVIPLSSYWLWVLPLLGILLGLIMAAWAPFGAGAGAAPPTRYAPPVAPPLDMTPPETPPHDTDSSPSRGSDQVDD